MAFKKGTPKPKNSGRKKGTQNKLTTTVKGTVLDVFMKRQENPKTSLEQFANDYPKEFYQMATKLIPEEINSTVQIKKVGVDLQEETKFIKGSG